MVNKDSQLAMAGLGGDAVQGHAGGRGGGRAPGAQDPREYTHPANSPPEVLMTIKPEPDEGTRLVTVDDALDPSLFVGSSREGEEVARHLQAALDDFCEPTVWTQGVFGATETTLSSLLHTVDTNDFAALVLTPDDVVTTRDTSHPSARDNAIFELGLFLGALGPERVFIVTPKDREIHLPSDLAGVTRLTYRSERRDGNLHAALGPATTEMESRIMRLGVREDRAESQQLPSSTRRGLSRDEEQEELRRELNAIARAAESQGWTVKTDTGSAFRLVSRNGQRYSFPIAEPGATRDRLRTYARQLSDAGLRVSSAVMNPVGATVDTAKPRPDKNGARQPPRALGDSSTRRQTNAGKDMPSARRDPRSGRK